MARFSTKLKENCPAFTQVNSKKRVSVKWVELEILE
jgi:hypothetical protein